MKRIFLHIGTHKTGSTSLQKLFADASEQLGKDGVLYPACGRPDMQNEARYGHHRLAWALSGKNGVNNLDDWRCVLEEIQTAVQPSVIISAERFEVSNDVQINQIKSLLNKEEVHVVVYLRNPVDYLISAYKQRVKMGRYAGTFAAFIQGNIHRCNYDRLITRWGDSFGPENVHVLFFEKCLREGGLEAGFLNLLQLPLADYRRFLTKPANVSPGDTKIKVLRWLNLLGLHNERIESTFIHQLRRRILRNTRGARALVTLAGLLPNRDVCRPQDRQWIEQITEEWNSDFLNKPVASEHQPLI